MPAARHKIFRHAFGSRRIAAMGIDDVVLYDKFVTARLRAVELMDAYRDIATDDPCRPSMWEGVVRQTESARCLLEAWLGSVPTERESRSQPRQQCAKVFKVSSSSTVNNPSDFR